MSTPQKSGVQSYREMMQKMKRLHTSLYKLQDQAVELQFKFADTNFAAAKLFDPDVSAILIGSSEKSHHTGDPNSTPEEKAELKLKIDQDYENMCQEVLGHARENQVTNSS